MPGPIASPGVNWGGAVRSCARAVAVVAALTVPAGVPPRAGADEESPPATTDSGRADLEDRLRRLEELGAAVLEQNRQLAEQNRRLTERNQGLSERLEDVSRRLETLSGRLDRPHESPASALPAATPPRPSPAPPWVVGGPGPVPSGPRGFDSISASGNDPEWPGSRFLVGGYNVEKGEFALVRPRDPSTTPFELNFDIITELRYTGFARSARTWTDSTGAVLPVNDLNIFELNRGWFQFSGYAIDPRLRFLAVAFYSSASNSSIFIGSVNYEFSKAFVLSGGYYKVPGSREWYDSFRYTLGADRTMATTFFRPGMSPGVWASGEPAEGLHYVAMLADSFNGQSLTANRVGTGMAFGGTVWSEPLGAFGPGPSDIEWHERPTPRVGTSVTVSNEVNQGSVLASNNPENTIFRLSDGTPLGKPGALAPGVTLNAESVQLWAIDAAVKYRGFSLSGESYLRLLDGFRTRGGPPPIRSLFDRGAYAQASYFVVPGRLEGYARYSFVTGRFGGGDEWAGGLNWYVRGARSWRMTFDLSRINHSPAENILTGYRAGESGTLFQVQMVTDF